MFCYTCKTEFKPKKLGKAKYCEECKIFHKIADSLLETDYWRAVVKTYGKERAKRFYRETRLREEVNLKRDTDDTKT